MKPRIFLGSSGKQTRFVQSLTRGLATARSELLNRRMAEWRSIANS